MEQKEIAQDQDVAEEMKTELTTEELDQVGGGLLGLDGTHN